MLRWPLIMLTVWTAATFVSPRGWRMDNITTLYVLTAAWVVVSFVWQWVALRRGGSVGSVTTWTAALVAAAFMATQTPVSTDTLAFSADTRRPPLGRHYQTINELKVAREIHRVVGGQDTQVVYLAFGNATYLIGNPTSCRYPSPLFLQRSGAQLKVSAATRNESLACLTAPGARWLVWQRNWLRKNRAAEDVLASINQNYDCDSARVIGGFMLCPRRG